MTEYESVISIWPEQGLHGRRKIYTDQKAITKKNVVEVVEKALAVHRKNKAEIQYLYDYYRGKQDIRCREKTVRPEINNKVMVNRANEIVTFKTAYFLGEPIQYISNGGDDSTSKQVKRLNDFMIAEDKISLDKEIVDWMHIAGVGARMISPDERPEENGSPLKVYTLDPRETFVIYHSGIGHEPLAGVIRQKDEDGNWQSCVYTKRLYFEIKSNKISKTKSRTVPYIPIIEYENNSARMGAFEVVLPLLNAINTIESNRVDDIEQFVQSILVFENCEISEEQSKRLKDDLGLMISSDPSKPAKVYRVDGQLSQSGAQTISDDLYDSVLTICGMPNRNGGSSTSDTGAATIMRDGWQAAESRAEDTEKVFNKAERQFLKVALYICRELSDLKLAVSDIKIEHTRNNLSNMQSRMQILCEGLNNDKIHPQIPWIVSGMPNAEEWYRISTEFYEKSQRELERSLKEEMESEESVSSGGQGAGTTEQKSGNSISESKESV